MIRIKTYLVKFKFEQIEIMNNTDKNFPIIFVLYAYFILFCN